jgi:AAA family ATP:ADP antiporter
MRNALKGFSPIANSADARRFALLIFIVGFGVELSRVAQMTFFLQDAGADQLPLVYVVFAVIMVIASVSYGAATKKVRLATLASGVAAFASVAIGLAWLLIVTGVKSVTLAYAFYCIVEMCFIFLPLTIWAVINEVFSAEDAERYLPPIAACGLIGALAGGIVTRLIVGAIGPYNTIPLAAIGYGICAYLCATVAKRPPVQQVAHHRPSRPLLKEPIVVTLTLLSLPMFVLAYVIEYMYYSTVGQLVVNATDQSQLVSTFGIICSVAAVGAQVFLTPLLFRRLGVGTTAFVYPSALALGTLMALGYALYEGSRPADAGPPSMWMALLVLSARALDIAIYQSVYDSTTHILYYAVPEEMRARARSLVGGVMFPASVACAGVLLMSFDYFHQPLYNVAFTALVIGFLVLVMGMDVRPDYLRSLLANSDDSNPVAREALLDEVSRLSLNESRVLLLESLQSDREDEALFVVPKLLDTYDRFLLEDLCEIRERIQPSVLTTLANAMAARGIADEDRVRLLPSAA